MKNKFSTKTSVSILMALSVIGLISSMYVFINRMEQYGLMDLPIIIVYIIALVYGLFLYKKPHGNMLKYSFLAFSLLYAFHVALKHGFDNFDDNNMLYIELLIIVLSSFMSGRLDKYEKNRTLMINILAMFIVLFVYSLTVSTDLLSIISNINYIVLWLTICFAYSFRFKEHKEAGKN